MRVGEPGATLHAVRAEDVDGERGELVGGSSARGDVDRVTTTSVEHRLERVEHARARPCRASTPTTPTSRSNVEVVVERRARGPAHRRRCAPRRPARSASAADTSSRPGEVARGEARRAPTSGSSCSLPPPRKRLDRREGDGGVVRLVLAVQRQEDVLVVAAEAPQRQQLAADRDAAVEHPELEPLAGDGRAHLGGPAQHHLGGRQLLLRPARPAGRP